jgi:hypothetical protein
MRMNPKPTVEEDLLWKRFYQHGKTPREQNGISKEEILLTWNVTRIEGYHKGSNHKMKDIQGCRLRI